MVRPLRAPARALSSLALATAMLGAAAIPATAVHGTRHHRQAMTASRTQTTAEVKASSSTRTAAPRSRAAQHRRAQIRWHVARDAALHALLHPAVSRVNLPAMYKSLRTLKRQAGGHLPFAAEVAVAWAYHELGRPYAYGAAGPYAFDCSGLTRYVWGKAGVTLDHYSGAQMSEGQRIASPGSARPGDVLEFAGMGHVALYVGDGWMIEASHSGTPVWRVRVPWYRIVGITRPHGR